MKNAPLFPVIMCGGAGTRLWPASRPSRPKQFLPLVGDQSLFQQTATRVAPLAADGGKVVVIGGAAHQAIITRQLAEVGVTAVVMLEPSARDSPAAMAAAAAWVQRQEPDGVLAVVASDHHMPDDKSFRSAVLEAAAAAAEGRIVTLGVRPSAPSSAYGYIRPEGKGLSRVAQFVEKPEIEVAHSYVAAGYLWNSGNFIVRASTLLDELRRFAPEVEIAARESLPPESSHAMISLLPAFSQAPKISIDYAVLEKTDLASVLETDFEWSDLGAWDAIAATGSGASGLAILDNAPNCLVRAPEGVVVAVTGVGNLSIVVERDAVLVCSLDRAQDVKGLVERIRTDSPRHLDFSPSPHESVEVGGTRLAQWLKLHALPVWGTLGVAANGSFEELLSLEGEKLAAPRRARVQARQVFSFIKAGEMGWQGPWRRIANDGLVRFREAYRRDDGLYRTLVSPEGDPVDDTAKLYDQAFVLLALAAAHSAQIVEDAADQAVSLRTRLLATALPQGGFREQGDHPYQSNAHMHFLEACLAWMEVDGDSAWDSLAADIVDLAIGKFIDRDGGYLREYFGHDWSPGPGSDGGRIEPGHQFEWSWLLQRYARMTGRAEAANAAVQLFKSGKRGVHSIAGVAVDTVDETGAIPAVQARLWPQTEWLKASLIMAEESANAEDRSSCLQDAEEALGALRRYLLESGLWRDQLLPDGRFEVEPAPASSFYHIVGAFDQLRRSLGALGLAPKLSL